MRVEDAPASKTLTEATDDYAAGLRYILKIRVRGGVLGNRSRIPMAQWVDIEGREKLLSKATSAYYWELVDNGEADRARRIVDEALEVPV